MLVAQQHQLVMPLQLSPKQRQHYPVDQKSCRLLHRLLTRVHEEAAQPLLQQSLQTPAADRARTKLQATGHKRFMTSYTQFSDRLLCHH